MFIVKLITNANMAYLIFHKSPIYNFYSNICIVAALHSWNLIITAIYNILFMSSSL